MKKLILVLFLLGGSILSNAQKKYLCEFTDTMRINLPDSVFAQTLTSSRPDIEIPPEVMQQFLLQIKQKPISMVQTRIVKATIEKTVISIDRSSRDGNLKTETFDSLLYKSDEIFVESSTITGFSDKPATNPKKVFLGTGRKVTILEYQCDEYMSADSTCLIWVTKLLPDYINPGIRKGNVIGAVLGFELRGEPHTTKCILSRFGISL